MNTLFGFMSVTTETVSEAVGGAPELVFKPENFVSSLSYMGSGMLGIFVVIGIIVAITYALNAITRKKK